LGYWGGKLISQKSGVRSCDGHGVVGGTKFRGEKRNYKNSSIFTTAVRKWLGGKEERLLSLRGKQ